MRRRPALFVALLAGLITASAHAEKAQDFPPGLFVDGRPYSLKDLEGKAVVLFFYEQDCPRCRGEIPARNAVVKQFEGKPVRFIAIAAGDTMQEANQYLRETHLAMPAFADNLSLMEKRYGFKISLQNIWQFRVISPDGNIISHSFDPADIEKAVAQVKWKYKDGGYAPQLAGAVDAFEWNNYADGMRQLKPFLKNSKKDVAESAKKLFDVIKAEGEAWLADADKAAAAENAVEAYDLYTKVSLAFVGDDLAKKAAEGLKKLATNQTLKDELAARKMYEQLCTGAARARGPQKAQVGEFAASIAKKFPKTPTGEKAALVAKELASGE